MIFWNFPFLPRIGEKLYTEDFSACERLSQKDAFLIIADIIWYKAHRKNFVLVLVVEYPD